MLVQVSVVYIHPSPTAVAEKVNKAGCKWMLESANILSQASGCKVLNFLELESEQEVRDLVP